MQAENLGSRAHLACHLNLCPVVTFENILVYVLHCLHRGTNFHVNVAVILLAQIGVIRHHPAIVKLMSFFGDCSSILRPAQGISHYINSSGSFT